MAALQGREDEIVTGLAPVRTGRAPGAVALILDGVPLETQAIRRAGVELADTLCAIAEYAWPGSTSPLCEWTPDRLAQHPCARMAR